MEEMNKNKEELLKQCFVGVATISERRQIVIPVEARERLNLQAGDKLLVFIPPQEGVILLILPSSLEVLLSISETLKGLRKP